MTTLQFGTKGRSSAKELIYALCSNTRTMRPRVMARYHFCRSDKMLPAYITLDNFWVNHAKTLRS